MIFDFIARYIMTMLLRFKVANVIRHEYNQADRTRD